MKASASSQGGFGEVCLVPVIAAFALCLFLLVPLLKLQEGHERKGEV